MRQYNGHIFVNGMKYKSNIMFHFRIFYYNYCTTDIFITVSETTSAGWLQIYELEIDLYRLLVGEESKQIKRKNGHYFENIQLSKKDSILSTSSCWMSSVYLKIFKATWKKLEDLNYPEIFFPYFHMRWPHIANVLIKIAKSHIFP